MKVTFQFQKCGLHFQRTAAFNVPNVAFAAGTLHLLLIHFSHQFPCSLHSAVIVMEGEGGLHWNNNKSVPLNTLDNSRAVAFTELRGQA